MMGYEQTEHDAIEAPVDGCDCRRCAIAERDQLRQVLGRIVYLADTRPFNAIGFVIEHQVPEARAGIGRAQ